MLSFAWFRSSFKSPYLNIEVGIHFNVQTDKEYGLKKKNKS